LYRHPWDDISYIMPETQWWIRLDLPTSRWCVF
jgi:hypothetical protein